MKKHGICTTCHYNRICSIKTTIASSWECSEYETTRVFLNQSVSHYTHSAPVVSSSDIKGLCNSCETKASCHWVQPDAVIFHCEHYQ